LASCRRAERIHFAATLHPEVGMDGCFFLQQGPGGEFQVAPADSVLFSSGSENFATDAPLIKKLREDSRVARCGP